MQKIKNTGTNTNTNTTPAQIQKAQMQIQPQRHEYVVKEYMPKQLHTYMRICMHEQYNIKSNNNNDNTIYIAQPSLDVLCMC